MEVEGLEVLTAALGRLRKVATAPDEILKDMGIVAERRIKRAFGEQKAPEIVAEVAGGKAKEAAGAAWAPLAEATIRRRRNKDKGSIKVLRDRGTLKGSIASIVAGGAVTIGTGLEVGKWHQGGTRNMPARPFVGINEEDYRTFHEIALRHLEAACR